MAEIIVETKTGARYLVGTEVIEMAEEEGFVYGSRINASPTNRWKRGRGAENGDIRWFYMRNVKIIPTNPGK